MARIRYGLFIDGKLRRVVDTLPGVMSSTMYRPWNKGCAVYKFTYENGGPVDAEKV